MLAAATAGIMVIGPVIIGYIPIMVVGALIFLLGIELLQEALVDTWGKLSRLEFLTVCDAPNSHDYVLLTRLGGHHRCHNGSLGLCHGHSGWNHLGMCQLRGSNLAKIRHSRHFLWRDCRVDRTSTSNPATVLARSWTADFDHEARWLPVLRNNRQR